MRNLHSLDHYRLIDGDVVKLYGSVGDANSGAFEIPVQRTGVVLKVIASHDAGWDHVSVSLRHRCPNWHEMQYVKQLFFATHEVAMQLHVADEDHLSIHPNCLHLWRPTDREIPLPPKAFV